MAGDRGRFQLGRGDPLRARLRHVRNAVGLAVIAYGLVWSTGFRGFMPLDQSIVWDAAWRLTGGQRPFVDFLMPNGLVPAALQAAVFAMLGPSWASYVLHAALANALFAVLVYALLASAFGRIGPALVYALSAASMLYPPIGTPYMDQHAVLLSALLIVLAANARSARWLWLVAPVGALAFLSKQTPASWALLWAGGTVVCLACRGQVSRFGLVALVIGAIATVCAGLALIAWLGASLAEVWLSLFALPGEIGASRLTWSWMAPRLGDAAKPGLLVVVVALVLSAGRQRPEDRAIHLAAAGIVAVAVLYVLLTDNSPWFGLGALPLAAGLAHALIERRVADRAGLVRHVGWIVAAVTAVQAIVVLVDTSLTRAANELRRADWARAERGEEIDRRLNGLVWALPPATARDAQAETGADAYRHLLRELRARPGGFVLVGDATILYSLAGRPSVFPALWFHPGLTYPRAGHPARPAFDAKLVQAMSRHDVRTIVIDGAQTWTGARAGDFAPLAACMARAEGTQSIGRFEVLTVPPGCGSG